MSNKTANSKQSAWLTDNTMEDYDYEQMIIDAEVKQRDAIIDEDYGLAAILDIEIKHLKHLQEMS